MAANSNLLLCQLSTSEWPPSRPPESSPVGLEKFDVAPRSPLAQPRVEFLPAVIFLVRFCIQAKMNTRLQRDANEARTYYTTKILTRRVMPDPDYWREFVLLIAGRS